MKALKFITVILYYVCIALDILNFIKTDKIIWLVCAGCFSVCAVLNTIRLVKGEKDEKNGLYC